MFNASRNMKESFETDSLRAFLLLRHVKKLKESFKDSHAKHFPVHVSLQF